MIDRLRGSQKKEYHPSPVEIEATLRVVEAFHTRDELSDLLNPSLLERLKKPGVFGVDQDDLNTAVKVAAAFGQRPSVDAFELEPLLNALAEEKSYAIAKTAENRLSVPGINFKSILAKRIGTAAMVGIIGWNCVGSPFYYYEISAEGRQAVELRKENEKKQIQDSEIQKKTEFEATHTLGLEFSSKSKTNWRIRYLPFDPNIELKPLPGEKNISNGSAGSVFSIFEDATGNSFPTEIKLNAYTRTDGHQVPQLDINTGVGMEQWVLLPNDPERKIDTRVIEFSHIDGYSKLFRLRQLNTAGFAVELTGVERVVKN